MKEFLEYLVNNPFEGNQQQCGTGKDYWNADYWTIEVTRCLISQWAGEDYSLPIKFRGNRFADINRIKKDAQIKLNIKRILEDIKDNADNLLICEVGRGLDIVVANQVKKWKKIYCYDQVDYSKSLEYFDNIEFLKRNTAIYKLDNIDECIVIMNHSIHSYKRFEGAVHGIIDGVRRW